MSPGNAASGQPHATAARPESPRRPSTPRRIAGLILGLVAALAVLAEPAPAGMPEAAWRVAAVTVLMAVWWVSEAIPIAATALVPVAAFPLLGVMSIEAAAAPYANPLVFLFLGGFCLARAMERWNLHERIALYVLRAVGTRPDRIVGGFMAATAGLSMWVSNTATATMMLPIAATVATLTDRRDDDAGTFHVGLLLAVAFGANIGGLGTLIGTPPNALFAGYLRESHGVDVGFAQWMLLGVPVAAVLLAAGWGVLTRLYCPPGQPAAAAPGAAGTNPGLGARLAALGPMTRGERLVLAVFLATAALWIARPFVGDLLGGRLSDAGIAVLAALVLFAVPVQPARRTFLLDWSDTARLPWGVLILVGGGLSLGAAVASSGLSDWIAGRLEVLAALPIWTAVAAFAAVVMAISHITSNTATAATFLPLAGSFAAAAAVAPALVCAPVVLAAGCAFMLPVATPPNAIVFATGRMTVADMLRAGALVNLLALGLVTAAAATLVPLVFA